MQMNDFIENGKQKDIAMKLAQIKHLCKKKGVASEILDQLEELEDLLLEQPPNNQNEISAQLSLYPLRQPSLSPTINEALQVLGDFGLRLIPGSMSTLILGKEVILWEALREVFSVASTHGEIVMIVSISNACPKPDC